MELGRSWSKDCDYWPSSIFRKTSYGQNSIPVADGISETHPLATPLILCQMSGVFVGRLSGQPRHLVLATKAIISQLVSSRRRRRFHEAPIMDWPTLPPRVTKIKTTPAGATLRPSFPGHYVPCGRHGQITSRTDNRSHASGLF